MHHPLTKTAAVIVSTTILTTLAVNAVDMQGNWSSTLLGALLFAVDQTTSGPCPNNMTLVAHALEPFCIDVYEASASDECSYSNPASSADTRLNLSQSACVAVSTPQHTPWRFVSYHDATQACTRAGKRLPTAGEWYMAALGTPDPKGSYREDECNVARNGADGVAKSGEAMRCVSDIGAYDMVGNVWEWVNEEVVKGVWNGRAMPKDGYVDGADLYGVAYQTSAQPNAVFAGDRFWSDESAHTGMMRGGYFDSKQYAGIFATHAASPLEFAGDAVGFRCVTAVQES